MKLLEWLMDKIKKVNFQKLSFSKRAAANLIIVFCLGLSLILISDFYKDIRMNRMTEEEDFSMRTREEIETSDNNASDYIRRLEADLSSILSKIQDAGKVSVMITLKSGGRDNSRKR